MTDEQHRTGDDEAVEQEKARTEAVEDTVGDVLDDAPRTRDDEDGTDGTSGVLPAGPVL
jgi:hypothetical protein